MKEIHIFSGLGTSIFSRWRAKTEAIETLIDKVDGVDAQHWIWNDWKEAADGIVNRVKAKKKRSNAQLTVVLVGHSNGVIAITETAHYLKMFGIEVDLLIGIDPTAASFPEVPENVNKVVEYHASSGWPAFKRWLTRGRGAALQRGLGAPHWKPRKRKSRHIEIVDKVRPEIVREISAQL